MGLTGCYYSKSWMEDRYDRQSTIIASQLPVEKWYEMFDDNTVADYPHGGQTKISS